MIRALIADDEQLARQRIRRLLASDVDFHVVDECCDGREAIKAINAHNPDVAFLDVQMPDLDGFAVFESIVAKRMPVVIFTTAYEAYAIKAFEAQALDYLLKPFDESRFLKAVTRVKNEVGRRNLDVESRRLTSQPQFEKCNRLAIKSRGRIVLVDLEDIDYIEAAANYVHIHIGAESHLLRESISSFDGRLSGRGFARIHRSTIVNLSKIVQLQPCPNGEFMVGLRCGKELSLSRTFRDRIEGFLQVTMAAYRTQGRDTKH